MDLKLDDDWIKKFENVDAEYKDFYKDDLYYVNLTFIYVNRENEIEKIKHESFLLSKPNHILREEILQILKKSSNEDERRYSLLALLKYNITMEPDDIQKYISFDTDINAVETNYLSVIKNIDSIPFDKTISMMHDLNDLILVFYEKSLELREKNLNSLTKKIYLRHTGNKKTLKKQYKD
jgi:hypothetical protein